MSWCLLFPVLLLLAEGTPLPDTSWQQYKKEYGKSYLNPVEETLRKQLFLENMQEIQRHNENFNAGLQSFKLGINQFTDMHVEELLNRNERLIVSRETREWMIPKTTINVPESAGIPLPDSFDWRVPGCVTPVRNISVCQSSVVYSIAGSIEGQFCGETGRLVPLSTQQIYDCMPLGCHGTTMDEVYSYLEKAGGLESEEDYPDSGHGVGSCLFDKRYIAIAIAGAVNISEGGEQSLKESVAIFSPVSVEVDASHISFQAYKSGVYYEPACQEHNLNHAMLVVGYGTDNGTDYWIVKNTWGTSWGESGYIRMSRNRNNNCGIASNPIFPVINYPPFL